MMIIEDNENKFIGGLGKTSRKEVLRKDLRRYQIIRLHKDFGQILSPIDLRCLSKAGIRLPGGGLVKDWAGGAAGQTSRYARTVRLKALQMH